VLIKKNSSILKYLLANILFALFISLVTTNILSSIIINNYDDYAINNEEKAKKHEVITYAENLQNVIEKEDLSFEEALEDDRFYSNNFFEIYLIDEDQNLYYLSQYSGIVTRGLLLTTTISSFPVTFSDKTGALLISFYYKSLDETVWFSLLHILFVILVFILIFHYRMKKVYGAFETLTSGVEIIGKGDLSFKIKENRIKEFSELSTTINKMATSLNQSNKEREEGEIYQKKLLSNISHDLRTPVTVIIGYLEVILNNEKISKEDKEKYLNISLNKSRQLKIMLDDFFTYNKLLAKDVNFSFLNVDLIFFLDQAINDYDLDISFEKNNDRPKITVDPLQFKRVLDNLFKNMVEHGDGDNKVVVKKIDNSSVITLSNKCLTLIEGDSNLMFKRTFMGKKSRKGNGSGLGLAIVKESIEKMNGSIESLYTDSTFTIIMKFQNMN
jgi:signal transduction histidine kinase